MQKRTILDVRAPPIRILARTFAPPFPRSQAADAHRAVPIGCTARMRQIRGMAVAVILFALVALTPGQSVARDYLWLAEEAGFETIARRIPPPTGYERLASPESSFASWLRGLSVREPGTPVRLFDGRQKANQGAAFAVVDIDVGARDLQQCADAVIRLRAEYLLAAGCSDRIAFDFTSGDRARWSDWRRGRRPVVSGNHVSWARQSDPDPSYASFRRYLNLVFTYAGSHSLARELRTVADPALVLPGDVFIQGGFPGHAVLVADVAADPRGNRVFLLLQSYMPAQDVHVLANPARRASAWYPALAIGELATPEWTFLYTDLRRFPEPDCIPRDPDGQP